MPEVCARRVAADPAGPGDPPCVRGEAPRLAVSLVQGPEGARELLPAPVARAPGLTREASDGATRAGLEKGGAPAKPQHADEGGRAGLPRDGRALHLRAGQGCWSASRSRPVVSISSR